MKFQVVTMVLFVALVSEAQERGEVSFQGRKEPNDDHYRSRFPPRVLANRIGGYR
jgi:hypothetical protein